MNSGIISYSTAWLELEKALAPDEEMSHPYPFHVDMSQFNTD